MNIDTVILALVISVVLVNICLFVFACMSRLVATTTCLVIMATLTSWALILMLAQV